MPFPGIRLLVTGGRDYADEATLWAVLDRVRAERGIAVLIHGAGRGADYLADRWAVFRGVTPMRFPAEWADRGRKAGPERNQRMLDQSAPQAVIGFPRANGLLGDGTADMLRRAREAGLPVWLPAAAWKGAGLVTLLR